MEDLIDTLEMLSSPEFRESIDRALVEVEKGETVVFEDIERLKTFLED